MQGEISVKVVEFGNRRCFQMRYIDPMTGRKKTKTTGIERAGKASRTKAERVAAAWESELRAGRYQAPLKITWAEFRRRYVAEKLSGLSSNTQRQASGMFNVLERTLSPKLLSDITAERLSHHFAEMRTRGRAENTIAGHVSYIRAALRWAAELGLLADVPKLRKPHRAKPKMKGRPISLEEFERMLMAVPRVMGDKVACHWRRLLTGFWLSGLRRGEAHALGWEPRHGLSVDLTGEFPMLKIPAAMQKANRDTLLPITPDFAAMLMETPESARRGYVFNPVTDNGIRVCAAEMGVMIGKIGRAAGIKVLTATVLGRERTKFASAQDLRRSFAARWAPRVMPTVLQELMRHRRIETTMEYYVGQNASTTARALWAQFGGPEVSYEVSRDAKH